jgi:acyl transferase domain-containing protein
MHFGVEPESMIGHSLGEYVAACLSGVFELEDALKLVALRGRLFETLPAGAMLSVPLGESDVLPYLTADLSLAGINAPRLCVVSGSVEAVKELQRTLAGRDVETRLLQVARAGHSSFVVPIMEEFARHVGALTLGRPRIPFVSNYTGTWIQDAEAADPRYWAAHLRHTVRFAAGYGQLLLDPDRLFLEVGPGRTLATLARQHPEAEERMILSSMRHVKDPQSDVDVFLQALAGLWTAGVRVDNAALYAHQDRRRLALPTYPFERRRHWVDAPSLPAEQPHAIQGASHQDIVEPRNEIEEAVARIWRDLLGTPVVGVDRSFGDAGGSESLLAEMQQRMAQEFGLVSVARCSTGSTIAGIADLVAERALEGIPQEELSRALADLDLPAM